MRYGKTPLARSGEGRRSRRRAPWLFVAGLRLAMLLLAPMLVTALVPGISLALAPGRAYEMVSPAFKGGYGVEELNDVAPDGEGVVFASRGVFAGALGNFLASTYLARRGQSGWETTSLNPPASLVPYSRVLDFSPTMGASLSYGVLGANSGSEIEPEAVAFFTHSLASPDVEGAFSIVGEVVKPKVRQSFYAEELGASANLSHVLFNVTLGHPLLPEAVGTESSVYELVSGSSGQALRFLALNNEGRAISPCRLVDIGQESGQAIHDNDVSADGEAVFFRLDANGTDCGTPHTQLFVRLGGSRTLEVSRPLDRSKIDGGCVGESGGVAGEVPCAGAATRSDSAFAGASRDGSRVFFTTTERLVAQDTDSGTDLYMASIECPGGGLGGCEASQREVTSLTLVSHGPEPADVQGFLRLASDGSRAYFVARGALSGANAEGGSPVAGADNLYVYDASQGSPVFIAELCSGPGQSGGVEDTRCPARAGSAIPPGSNYPYDTGLWLGTASSAPQANVCLPTEASCEPGRFLVFVSSGQLTGDDTDAAADVYRYDAASGTLTRVSRGEEGYDADGNNSLFDAEVPQLIRSGGRAVAAEHGLEGRLVSADGSQIVFTTAEPLSPDAGNGLLNAYEWREGPGGGSVAMVSTGSSDRDVKEVTLSPSGRDVFFNTTQGLISEDTDGQRDVYDARLEGGFPEPPAAPQPCSGDACQGPLTNPAPLLVPGSVSQAPGGNFTTHAERKAKARAKTRHKRRSRKRRHGVKRISTVRRRG